jgi:ATP-dependent Clp protease protease subunit
MIDLKYLAEPFRSDDDEEPQKEEKPEQSPYLMKKMEQLFLKNRAVYLWGAVDDKSARDAVSKLILLDADKPGKEIKFYINSPGGIVTSGMVIYDTIQMIQSPVSTICMGLAASMGSILLSGGVKGKRFIYPHGEVMIHQPSIGGYFQAASADIEIHAKQMQRTKEISAQILAKNTGKSLERILKDFDRDYWMDAKEAVDYGIVDDVVEKL